MAVAAKEEVGDIWNVTEFKTSEKPWSEKTFKERLTFVGVLFGKLCLMVLILYLFIISLDLMSNAFRILGGKTAGRTFRNSEIFDNPIAGLVIGLLVTVLVQSSSTSTSIIVTMTAGDLIEIKNAVPMIMGANIGTSVTNTIVSLGSIQNRDEYRRAFAGATVHDCFNLLTVVVLLPIEVATGMLRHSASAILAAADITDNEEKGAKTDFLKVLTSPVASRLLSIDKKLITKIAQETDLDKLKEYEAMSILKHKQSDSNHMFLNTPMDDEVAGVLMLFVALIFLCVCLMMLVQLLQTIFRGRIAIWFRAALNLEIKSAPPLANYILIVFGMLITILFQSSSVTTSTLTPLVGIGLVRLDKMFAFTIGANLGTTITGILSALVSDKRKTGLTVAFTHTLFNIAGFLIFYPLPFTRNIPIRMAKTLGNIAAEVQVFPIIYLFVTFGLVPFGLLGLSIASVWALVFVGLPLLMALGVTFVILGIRLSNPERLPLRLRGNPSWLPKALHVKRESAPESPDSQSSGGAAVALQKALQTRSETPSEDSKSTGDEAVGLQTTNGGAVDADLGGDKWALAPAAWGTAWFVLLALLIVVPNCQWGFVKYQKWDGRDHMGVGAWTTCSSAFKEEKLWAPKPDASLCTQQQLATCGGPDLSGCTGSQFSSTEGVYEAYQSSWSKCRGVCSSARWEAWCMEQRCGGGKHVMQCTNVTKAVQGLYDVQYGPADGVAWAKGELCRDVKELCPGMEGSLKVVGDLSAVGLVGVGIGLILLLGFQFFNGKRDLSMMLNVSLGSFFVGWLFLFGSWVAFSHVLEEHTACIVDDESNKGAVWAKGRFADIFFAGGYGHGFIIGAWMILMVTMFLIFLRIKTPSKPKTKEAAEVSSADSSSSRLQASAKEDVVTPQKLIEV